MHRRLPGVLEKSYAVVPVVPERRRAGKRALQTGGRGEGQFALSKSLSAHFLLPEFTVLENVMIPMLRRGGRSEDDAAEHARAVLSKMGLSDLVGRRPHQLSGGQQQRVSIAHAVANDPRIVLADEPTGNLDSRNGLVVMDIFEMLVRERGITVVMVTHERTFAGRACRQLVMRDGHIVHDIDQRSAAPR